MPPVPTTPSRSFVPVPTGITMREAERNHIVRALEKTKWKVSGKGGAAELLQMNHNTLLSRIKKLGIKKTIQYVTDK